MTSPLRQTLTTPATKKPTDESGDALAAAAAAAEVDPADEFKAKLRRQEGDWYVIHSYAGYENRVKANLETRIQTLDMEDYIFEIQVPMEEVVEIKNAQRKVINRVRIPGYVLVRMDLTDASWGAVRHTPGVTGFVGNAHNPVPLRLDEVFSMLAPVFEEEQAEKGKPVKHAAAQVDVDFEVGESVIVKEGPVRDPSGHDLRNQGGLPDPRGAGLHLRARNPGHAGIQPGQQDLVIPTEFAPDCPL